MATQPLDFSDLGGKRVSQDGLDFSDLGGKRVSPGLFERADKAITSTLATNPENYRDWAHTQIEVPKTLGREAYSGVKALAGLPGGIYHAFADPATAEETEEFGGPEQVSGMKRVGLGVGRLTAEPLVNAVRWYRDAATGKVPNATEQALDVAPEAMGQGGAAAIAPELTKLAGRGIGAAARGTLRPTLRVVGKTASFAGDSVDPDLVGLASPRAAHALRLSQKVGRVASKLGAGPEDPGVYPGAPLPAAPPPELLQARALERGGTAPVDPAAGLGRIPLVEQIKQSAPPSNVRTPGQIAPLMIRPRAYSPRPPAGELPPSQGPQLALPAPRNAPPPRLIEQMGSKPVETITREPLPDSYYAGPGSVIKRGPVAGSQEDVAETRSLREQVRDAADAEQRTFASQQTRDWFGRNQPGTTKGELTGQPGKPVRYSKTPGVKLKDQVKAGTTVPGPDDDLTPLLKKSLKQAIQERGQ